MNPYDASTHPGAHLVAETFAVSDVSTLNTPHPPVSSWSGPRSG